MPSFRRLLVLFLAVLASVVAQAHDALQSSLELCATPEALEITAVLSRPTASGLLEEKGDAGVTRDNFASLHAELLAAAPRVCALLDADGKALAPSRIHVSLNRDGEVVCFFEYPAGSKPASLRVDLLSSLGSGYFFEVTDRMQSPVRRAVLGKSKPACLLSAGPR